MDKQKCVELFNNTLSSLADFLVRSFPEDEKFKIFKNGLNVLKLADEKKAIRMYISRYSPTYRDNVKNKNVDFFIENDHNELNVDGDSMFSSVIGELKKCWDIMNENDREIVWKYFQTIDKIIEKYE
jgi:hypothetical protein